MLLALEHIDLFYYYCLWFGHGAAGVEKCCSSFTSSSRKSRPSDLGVDGGWMDIAVVFFSWSIAENIQSAMSFREEMVRWDNCVSI